MPSSSGYDQSLCTSLEYNEEFQLSSELIELNVIWSDYGVLQKCIRPSAGQAAPACSSHSIHQTDTTKLDKKTELLSYPQFCKILEKNKVAIDMYR